MSIFSGLAKVAGALGDAVSSPFKLLAGDVDGAISGLAEAPFKAAGGTLEAAFGAVTLPIRLPFVALGTIFGSSQAAMTGSQNAIVSWTSQQQSPGYW
jgi:hypothetical protein